MRLRRSKLQSYGNHIFFHFILLLKLTFLQRYKSLRRDVLSNEHFTEWPFCRNSFRRKLFILLEIFRLAKLSAVQFVQQNLLIGQFFLSY
jgi:hypothetical protein